MHAVIPAAAEPIPLMEVKTGSPNWDPDPTSVAWQDGRLYYGSQDGLQMMGAEGEWEMLDETLQINKLAPLGNNQMAVGSTNALAIWDVEQRAMQIEKEIDDGTLDEITSDGGGGLFYTVIAEDKPATLTHQNSKGQIQTTEQPVAGAGALGNDGQTLFWTADGELTLQALALDSEHQPTDVRAFAEIFMADGKYGRQRPDRMQHTASGLTVDRDGRFFYSIALVCRCLIRRANCSVLCNSPSSLSIALLAVRVFRRSMSPLLAKSTHSRRIRQGR